MTPPLLPLLPAPAMPFRRGANKVYFTVPGARQDPLQIAAELASRIDAAQRSIDVSAYSLTHQPTLDALQRAADRGVLVRTRTSDNRGATGLMHNKYMVFDNQAVWTGSMNFNERSMRNDDNNVNYIESTSMAANYTNDFEGRAAPHRVLELPGGDPAENYFSPSDRVDLAMINAVRNAQRSVRFMAFAYTHRGIEEVMRERAAAGVHVEGVLERSQVSRDDSVYMRLRAEPNTDIQLDVNPANMHHKVMIIDDETVITGSANFSRAGASINEENTLIIHSPTLAQRYQEEFARIHALAGGRTTPPPAEAYMPESLRQAPISAELRQRVFERFQEGQRALGVQP